MTLARLLVMLVNLHPTYYSAVNRTKNTRAAVNHKREITGSHGFYKYIE